MLRFASSSLRLCALLSLALLPAQAQGQGWPMQGGDAQRTGRASVAGPITAAVKWTYDLKGAAQDNASPIIGPDGTIYALSKEGLFAINPGGTLKWKKENHLGSPPGSDTSPDSESPSSEPPNPEAEATTWGQRNNAPALSPDGTVLYTITSWLMSDTAVRALDAATGALRWKYVLGSNLSYSSLAVAANGTIFVGTWKPALYAINPNGTLQWRYDSPSRCGIEAPPAVAADGSVYFGHNCVGLVALSPNGKLRWTNGKLGEDYDWPTPAIGRDGTIFADRYAFRPDGKLRWRRTDLAAADPPYLYGHALSADGSMVYRATQGRVYALDSSTGATRWACQIAPKAERFGGSPLVSANDVLYIMGDAGGALGNDSIYALSAVDGRPLWTYKLHSTAVYWGPPSPALGPDGTLYVVSSGSTESPGPSARLYAFGGPTGEPAKGPSCRRVASAAPTLTLGGPRTQGVLRQGGVIVFATASEDATLTASGTVTVPGTKGGLRLKEITRTGRARKRARLFLGLSKRALAVIGHALARGKPLAAKVTVTATDLDRDSRSASREIKLER